MGIYRNFSTLKRFNNNATFLQRSLAISSGPPRLPTKEELKTSIANKLYTISSLYQAVREKLDEIDTQWSVGVLAFSGKYDARGGPPQPAPRHPNPLNPPPSVFRLDLPPAIPNLDTAPVQDLINFDNELQLVIDELGRYSTAADVHSGEIDAWMNQVTALP